MMRTVRCYSQWLLRDPMETNLLDKMLSTYRSQKTPVTIVLQNKNRFSAGSGCSTAMSSSWRTSEERDRLSPRNFEPSFPRCPPSRPQPREQKVAHATARVKTGPKPRTTRSSRQRQRPGRHGPSPKPRRQRRLRIRPQQQHEGRPPAMDAGTEGGKIA